MSRGLESALLTGASAVLLAAALPNEVTLWGNPLLGPIAIAPFFAAATLADRPRRAAALGALFGGLHTLLSSFWLLFFQQFAVWTLGGVVLAYTGFGALLGAVLHGVARAAATPARGRPTLPGAEPGLAWRPFLLATVWTVYEFLKSSGFLGYPWGLVAHPVHDLLPLIQIADITGVWGVSLLMALINALVAEGILRARSRHPGTPARGTGLRQTAAVAALLAAALGYGGFRLAQPDPAEDGAKTLRLVLVQPNGDPWEPYGSEELLTNEALTEEGVRAGVRAGGPPDLVVWSETSLSFDPRLTRNRSLETYLRRLNVAHLSGAPIILDARRRLVMNGAVLLDPAGTVREYYGKQHPVPFAEAIPFWGSPAVQWFFTHVVGIDMPWVMGDRSVVFQTPLGGGGVVRFGVPICFEDAFGDLNRRFVREGADLLINISNDSWSRTVSALIQHFVVAKYRAVETRRPLARSTNGGITAVVDTRGRVTELLGWFQKGYVHTTILLPKAPRMTAYVRFGDWLPAGLAAILVLYLGAMVWRARAKP